MPIQNLYKEIVTECKCKLDRELTKEEVELIKWIQEKHYECFFRRVKSS
ncbi:hypothetical protein [Halalkalibacter krulwichiae]|uniref:Uncharacterized protein n=1 Tax=Halalkalibacter krulwichiae TaxID=199441 RepID=A0A1X9MEE0_9BACI|nr:hypothetical protein [Halalkalibacter krulwichiae]ARK31805.1 hypothetical protein BkAM31D_19270 [Halalkalibacter krulwichiae]